MALIAALLLLVLLPVVAIAGFYLLFVVGPPLYRSSSENAHKRTASDIRTIAAGVEAYRKDRGSYPDTDDFGELQRIVRPYVARLPSRDAWGSRYRYACRLKEGNVCTSYRIVSASSDRRFEDDPEKETLLVLDIVWVDGRFIRVFISSACGRCEQPMHAGRQPLG